MHHALTSIGITVTVSTFVAQPPYLFDTVQSSSLRWAPILGGLTGQPPISFTHISNLFPDNLSHIGFGFGYFFNNWIYRSRQERWRPEYRLHGVWFAIGTMAAGLLTYGLTLHFHKHWIGLAFGWGMVVAGMIASTVYVNASQNLLNWRLINGSTAVQYADICLYRSITSYALDKYPDQSTVVSAIINGWRTASGFSVGYFQPTWIAKNGLAAVFATQAGVVVAVLVLTITPVIAIEGKRARAKGESNVVSSTSDIH